MEEGAAAGGPRRSARLVAKTGDGRSRCSAPSTAQTSSSVVKAREAELQARKDTAAVEDKLEQATREIELLEHSVKTLIDQVDELNGQADGTAEEIADRKKEVKALEKEIRRITSEVTEKRINLKYLGKWAEREKGFLEEQKEINKLQLELAENLSQELTGEEIPELWEEDFVSAQGDYERPDSPETQDLMRRLLRVRGEDTPPVVGRMESKPLQQQLAGQQVAPDGNQVAVNNLAAALTEAMKTAVIGVQQKDSKTDKLIARQTIKQDLGQFDGNPEEWPIFVSQYRTVSEECGLSAVENLQRLQKGLKGEARECVRALLLSPENVEKIIQVLTRRYGDPEVVVQRLLKQAQQLPYVKEGDFAGILKFADVVRNLAATAVSMGCAPFLTNPQLLTELVAKLPVSLQVDWTKEKRNLFKTFADLKDFATWIEDLSEIYVKLNQPAIAKKIYQQPAPWKGKGAVSVMVANDECKDGSSMKQTDKEKKDRKCLYCQTGPHFIANCSQFKSLSLEERWKWVRGKNHCFNCLQFGHIVSKCYAKKECGVEGCTRNHHPILHKKEEDNAEGEPEAITHASIASVGSGSSHINLMIVPVVLRGPAGEVKTFAMMDTGSTVTLLDEDVARRLGLKGTPKQLSFRGLHPAVQHEKSEVVDFEVRGLREKISFKINGADRDQEPSVYEMEVLIFGASCSPSIAQEVKNRNAKEYEEKFPDAVLAILEKFFVDDYLDSCDTVSEAIALQAQVREICSSGGFRLCNWISSADEVMEAIPEDLGAVGKLSLDMEGEVNVERVLGLFWLPKEDKLTFSLNFVKAKEDLITGKRLPSKREFLALLMTIFDPLGLVGNFTVKAKIMLQSTWKSQVGWDDDIPASLSAPFLLWLEELNKIEEFLVPRCYSLFFTSAERMELHVFCDASEEAFGAVAYFRVKKETAVEVALVCSKSRVAPLKSLSIPRLELQAALLGCRTAEFIRESHEITIDRTVYWSDSRTVLCWLKSEGKRYHAFVAHRVGEIQEKTNPEEWRWIPTAENVADELTRLGTPSDFIPGSRWVCGPSFLKMEEEEWPVLLVSSKTTDIQAEILEMKKDYVGAIMKTSVTLIDYKECPCWMKLVRRMAQVIKFTKLYLQRGNKKSSGLTPVDLRAGEEYLLWVVQRDSFAEERECLRQGKSMSSSSRLKTLCVTLDSDGIVRVRGRLDKAKCVTESAKHPIVLDNKHPLTRLLIEYHHVRGGHHGLERVVNELRQKYHILNSRSAVRSVWSSCQVCKNWRARPIAPEMAALPMERVADRGSPFNHCGVDYFGPMEVTVGRHHEKRYGALFTCLSTRAVHLEVAHSLSTDSCIMTLRSFFGRRGCPTVLWSDNGTNFRGAAVELKKALEELDQERLKDECCNRGVEWKFIPPAAPHMGGSWERLVRSVKVALHSTLNERYPSDEVLLTLLIEAEHIVNSRPLTHVSIDPEDPEALTPNHFLIGRSSNVQVPGEFNDGDLCLRKQWRKAQVLTEMFWSRWVKEFLPSLLNREKWQKKTVSLKTGDVVLEVDPNNPRNTWPMGVVQRTFPGGDGQVRMVDVKFTSGVLRRPTVKLAKLDVQGAEEVVDVVFGEEAVASSRAGDCRRPKREESSSDEFECARWRGEGRGREEEERKESQ